GLERGGVRDVAANDLDAEFLQRGGVRPGACEGADAVPAAREGLGDVRPDEPGGPGDENGVRHAKSGNLVREQVLSGERAAGARAGRSRGGRMWGEVAPPPTRSIDEVDRATSPSRG